MSFTTWVRAQDAFGQFDVRKDDDLRDGVTLVSGYPEHIGLTARPGKPFVNIGIVAAGGYSGLNKQALYDEIARRNQEAVVGNEAIEVPAKASVRTLVGLLEADDEAGEAAAAAAIEAGGIDPVEDPPPPSTDSSGAQASGTGEDPNTTEAGAPGGSE